MNRKNNRDIEEELKETIVQLKETIDTLQDSLSNRSSFNNLQRHKVTSSGYDIICFSPIFMGIHKKAERAWNNDEKLMNELGPLEYSKISTEMRKSYQNELGTVYKAMFYFVRAYQDTLYGSLRELSGEPAGKYTTIMECLSKKGRQYRDRIEKAIPRYFGWFISWREKRNKIKSGISCSLGKQSDQLGIILSDVDGEKNAICSDMKSLVTPKDVIEAVKMSHEFAEYVSSIAAE